MAVYKCFQCKKEIEIEPMRRTLRCRYCGSNILFKPRTRVTKIKAD